MNPFFEALGRRWSQAASRRGAKIAPPELDAAVADELLQLATSSRRVEKPLYRAPGATAWEEKSWDFVLDKIAANMKASRDNTVVAQDASGNVVNRTEGIAFAGGAAFSSEEGYFATKLMRTLGVVHIEQQARV